MMVCKLDIGNPQNIRRLNPVSQVTEQSHSRVAIVFCGVSHVRGGAHMRTILCTFVHNGHKLGGVVHKRRFKNKGLTAKFQVRNLDNLDNPQITRRITPFPNQVLQLLSRLSRLFCSTLRVRGRAHVRTCARESNIQEVGFITSITSTTSITPYQTERYSAGLLPELQNHNLDNLADCEMDATACNGVQRKMTFHAHQLCHFVHKCAQFCAHWHKSRAHVTTMLQAANRYSRARDSPEGDGNSHVKCLSLLHVKN